jgi:hypothetical protein
MKEYVRQRGDRYYAVIYESRDPVTGKERRTWHPAGTDRVEAERLAVKLAAAETVRVGAVRSPIGGAGHRPLFGRPIAQRQGRVVPLRRGA